MHTSKVTVSLPNGRAIVFASFDYIGEHPGTRWDPPTPAEVTIAAACWIAPDGTETACTEDELEELHDSGPDYDAILLACEEHRGEMAADRDPGE
jgi:hypothetical protein